MIVIHSQYILSRNQPNSGFLRIFQIELHTIVYQMVIWVFCWSKSANNIQKMMNLKCSFISSIFDKENICSSELFLQSSQIDQSFTRFHFMFTPFKFNSCQTLISLREIVDVCFEFTSENQLLNLCTYVIVEFDTSWLEP